MQMGSHILDVSSYDLVEKQINAVSKCTDWLESSNDDESVCTESSSFSTFSDSVAEYSNPPQCCEGNQVISSDNEILQHELESTITQSQNVYTNIKISKSKNVHLGNITYINGPVYINQRSTVVNNQMTINQHMDVNNDDNDAKPPLIISRTYWLAQPPTTPYTFLNAPAKFVIICHSGTEEMSTQPANILLVRSIQQYHIENKYFGDIAYNFLVGADGNVYEGLGWNIVGSHTYKYNKLSMGICFMGTFCVKLPAPRALKNIKKLIAYGVRHGFIDNEYSLLGHCQCSSIESPGEALFEELKTWERFDHSISISTPSPLIN